MLRSVRLILDLFAQGKSGSLVSLCDEVDSQVHSNSIYCIVSVVGCNLDLMPAEQQSGIRLCTV